MLLAAFLLFAAHALSIYFLLNHTLNSCPSTVPAAPSGALKFSFPLEKLARYMALTLSFPLAWRKLASSCVNAEWPTPLILWLNSRCTPPHDRHTNVPNVRFATWGNFAEQSAHFLFPGRRVSFLYRRWYKNKWSLVNMSLWNMKRDRRRSIMGNVPYKVIWSFGGFSPSGRLCSTWASIWIVGTWLSQHFFKIMIQLYWVTVHRVVLIAEQVQ